MTDTDPNTLADDIDTAALADRLDATTERMYDHEEIVDGITAAEMRAAARLLRTTTPPATDVTANRARALLDAYPEDVFPPLTDTVAYVELGSGERVTVDRVAAHALRVVALPVIADLLTELHEAWMERSDAERESDTLRAEVARLLDAIGEHPTELLVQSEVLRDAGFHFLAGLLRRIADAAAAVTATTNPHTNGDTDG